MSTQTMFFILRISFSTNKPEPALRVYFFESTKGAKYFLSKTFFRFQ